MSDYQIKVLLVDDHAVVRAGFKMLLVSVAGLEVCGEAERGEEAIQLYLSLKPDIVVMDLSMPGIGGLETIRRLIRRDDQAKILVFSVHHEQVYVNRAIDAGAKGYITKNSAPDILPAAIENIVKGKQYIEKGLMKSVVVENYQIIVDAFSPREFDIFRLLAKGLSAQSIAYELCLGYKTVANYSTQIKRKLNVINNTELLRIAHTLGINRIPE